MLIAARIEMDLSKAHVHVQAYSVSNLFVL